MNYILYYAVNRPISLLVYMILFTCVTSKGQSTSIIEQDVQRADSLFKNKEYDLAYHAYMELSERFQDEQGCHLLLQAGRSAYLQDSLAESFEIFEKCQQIAYSNGYGDLLFLSVSSIGGTLSQVGERRKANRYYLEALQIGDSLGYHGGDAVLHYNLGLNFKEMGLFDESIGQLNIAIRLFEADSNQRYLARAYQTLANAFREVEKDSLSLFNHKKALEMFRENGEVREMSSSLQDIGNTYKQLKDYPKALAYYEQSLATGDSAYKATTIGNMAEVYHALGDNEKARFYYQESIRLKRKKKDKTGVAHTLTQFGDLYLALGEYENAKEVLNEGAALAEEEDYLIILLQNYEIQQRLYAKVGDFKSAFAALTKYKEVNELLNDENKREITERMTAMFELKELEQQNRLLHEESKLNRLQAEKERAEKRWLLTGFISSAILLVLFGRLYNQSKKHARWQEVKRRELQHRTKNSLQTLINLFRFQERFAKAPGEQDLLKQGLSRVDAIMMINQKLSNTKEELNFTEYVQELVELNYQNYKVEIPNLKVEWDVEEIEVNPSQATLTGLIVNELINNAFKYAFKGNSAPLLKVSLKEESGTLYLTIHDNGAGWNVNITEKKGSEGLELVEIFAKQLKAEFKLEFQEGTRASLVIKKEPATS
ncbi:tetratricopeptide repeat protein [Phaeocystidibacter marisrubri]|uniref:histidine kinase n=1 Tax=Phaeocystidibacter marisrubri TaxID=1577780 RepID=A0A6L3ZGP3_9FLAO|nr:tetratricopeptide repeat protein [Phaeocystidibacter marisrubri]KAB2817081.1 tetratricopeptide repeat protein [Phaeocystidibacter marisrubri]